jgi:hypothetical protein
VLEHAVSVHSTNIIVDDVGNARAISVADPMFIRGLLCAGN